MKCSVGQEPKQGTEDGGDISVDMQSYFLTEGSVSSEPPSLQITFRKFESLS